MACVRKRRGKWVVDYRDGAGKRRWTTCPTLSEAKTLLDEKARESRQGRRPVVDPDIAVGAYAKRWLRIVQASVKPSTLRSYEGMLRLHILPVFEAVKIRHLQRGRIKAWLAEVLAAGEFARESVRLLHATLRTLLNAAIDDNLILANPADKLARQLKLSVPPGRRQDQIKAMTREQVAGFLATAARTEPRLSPLFFTLARTGMRLGEVFALQWTDLNFVTREIRVERGFSRGRLETPKSGVGRTVDMSQQLARTLRRVQVDRKAEALRRGWSSVPEWVFCTAEGKPYDPAFAQRVFKRVLKAAKLPLHFTPHGLRHTFASLLLQAGESPVYVQRQLGHASIKLTVDTYGRWLPMGNKAAVDRVDEGGGSKVVAASRGRTETALPDSQLRNPIRLMSW